MRKHTAFLPSLRTLALLGAIGCFVVVSGGSAHAQLKGMIDNLAAKFSTHEPELRPGFKEPSDLPKANKEIGEMLTPRALLKDSPELQKLLGENPLFVYDPAARPDPMLIPWTRAKVMFGELNAIAEQAIVQKNWQMAEVAYRHMLTDLNEPEYRAKAQAGLEKLGALVAEAEAVRLVGEGVTEAKLPPWVSQNTRAIIFDKSEPMCMVGTFALKVGDTIPRQPVDVTIAKIDANAVHYKVHDKTFIVKVQEGE